MRRDTGAAGAAAPAEAAVLGASARWSEPSAKVWVGFAFAVASAVGFAFKAILAKLAYRTGVNATTVLGLRMGFSFPAYLALAWLGAKKQPRQLSLRAWSVVAILGLLGYYLASYLDFVGLTRISAGLERLILFLYPSMVVVLAALRSGRKVRVREWQSMLLGYAGIACVFFTDTGRGPHGSAAWLGVLAVFASSLSYAAYLVYAERVVAELGSLRFTGLAMSFACVFSISHFFLAAPSFSAIPGTAVYLCLCMALFSTVVPTWLLTEAVRRIGSGRAALCGMIGPVLTVGLEVLLLGEQASWADALGTVLVIASVVLLTRDRRAHQK